MPYIYTQPDNTVVLRLYVQPQASKSRLVGLHDGCLKLAIAAPPVDGKANKQVLKFLAAVLGITGRDLFIKAGAQSRRKQVVVKTLDEDTVRKIFAKSVSSLAI